ncbi:hypothetical protein MM213_11880 [Belliella sp. R4-6]|uniref:Uncharacterized protein n=1 Tax=Belliella alkalica TaxID=1730871 RepID=A0ABS9VCN7_9BACT|nr:hypothetical protein [Belliella alkalica]MCH7414191.1 hypothetical protein [Belliella alkalica]
MNHILGIDRFQVTFSSLEDAIPKENAVRVIDAFIDKHDLNLLGFISKSADEAQTKKHTHLCVGAVELTPYY